MKIFVILMLVILGVSATQAGNIEMFGKEKYGFTQPRYTELSWEQKKQLVGVKVLEAIAAEDHFPFCSSEQGSVFTKIFESAPEKTGTYISIYCDDKNYKNTVTDFERGKTNDPNALFGVYYEEVPYSKNQFIYPAFFTNNVHLIYSSQNKLNVSKKADLKNYKGVRVSTDRVSKTVAKEFESLNIKEVDNFSKAFEELLTGTADYLVAGYYTSLVEVYKFGIRDYVTYSKNPVWKMPMFIKVDPKVKKDERIKEFEKYLKTQAYAEKREDALRELIEMYKENTRGIVPPTYISSKTSEEEKEIETEE